MSPLNRRDVRHLIVFGVFAAIAGVGLAALVVTLRSVLLVLYVSTLLAIGFSPAVHWIERRRLGDRRRRMPRWAAILALYVGGLLLFAGILAVILPPFVGQVTELTRQLPSYVDQFETQLLDWGLISQRYTWKDLLGRIQIQNSGTAVAGILGALQSALGAVGSVATVLLLPFYLLVEWRSIQRGFVHLFPKSMRPMIGRMAADVTVKVGAWLGGQMLLGMVIGTTAAIGLWLIGVPYFYVFGLIAAIGEFIPIVGPILAAIPAVLVAWTVSGHTAVFTAVYFAVQQFVENNFLVPRIMERQVGVSAVTVLVALLVGTELLGVIGALLAVPSAAIVQVLLQEFLDRDEA
ncbi:MAG: AI-2E family transporter [Vicinamibacterales bacterium]